MTVSTIILAAGKGTRMRSPIPKILHKIAGKYLIAFGLDLAKAIHGEAEPKANPQYNSYHV